LKLLVGGFQLLVRRLKLLDGRFQGFLGRPQLLLKLMGARSVVETQQRRQQLAVIVMDR
jgi:hypothetical protein